MMHPSLAVRSIEVVELELAERHDERLEDGLERVLEVVAGLAVGDDEEAEAEAHDEHHEVDEAAEQVGEDGVEHEGDAAADEGVAAHQEDELQVGEADPGRRDPHQDLGPDSIKNKCWFKFQRRLSASDSKHK